MGPGRKLLLAMKANAYGHGAAAVAAMAERAGLVDWLGVATVPEGLELRRAGIRLPILKFSPAFPEEMAAALDAGITLPVCDLGNIQALQSICAVKGVRTRVHLKVETGMGRIGVPVAKAPGLALHIETLCPALDLEGVFTHLPVSDEAQGAAFTGEQIAAFRQTVEQIAGALGRTPELRHCVSSGGVLGHPDGWFTLVRTGTLGYGYYPVASPTRPLALRPGLSLVTRIAHRTQVPKGTWLDPRRSWAPLRDTWVAALPVGFGDGLNRLMAGRGRVLVQGRSCPMVGEMDVDRTLIDLGPDSGAQVGDQAVLIGRSGDEEITAYEVARLLDTIPADITSRLGARVERIYG